MHLLPSRARTDQLKMTWCLALGRNAALPFRRRKCTLWTWVLQKLLKLLNLQIFPMSEAEALLAGLRPEAISYSICTLFVWGPSLSSPTWR